MMKFEEEQIGVPGLVPEFGAIFMSNSATKKECFKRKLFGLPSSFAYLVEHVKAGMILFLFEYERRELYGVFRACTDGAINIMPNAFTSSGKQFPAQVKFTRLWDCIPLSEDEFRDAIKENYFSPKKFHFGLSENQVHRLLSLFSLRKLKVQGSQRQNTSDVVSISGNSSYPKRPNIGNKNERDSQFWHVNTDEDKNVKRVINAGSFGMTAGLGNKSDMDSEPMAAVSTKNYLDSLDLDGNEEGCSRATIPMQHPGLFDPTAPFARNSKDLNHYFFGQNQLGQLSSFDCLVEQQASKVSPATSCRDAVVTSTLPYDLDGPSISYMQSSSPRLQEFAAFHDSNAGNISPFLKNQSSMSYLEPRGSLRSTIADSDYGYSTDYSMKTCAPFMGSAYSENMALNPSDIGCYRGLSFEKPVSSTVVFPKIENGGRIYDSFSPSQYPSFVLNHENFTAFHEKHDQEMVQSGIDEAFGSNTCQPQDHISPVDYRNLCSDGQNNRKSVFSRLALDSKVCEEENSFTVGCDGDHMDTSVEDVMSMLHHCQYQWKNMRKHMSLINDHSANTRKRKHTTFNPKLVKNQLQVVSKETKKKIISANQDEEVQFVVSMPFVDFKRRSEMQKTPSQNTQTPCSNDNAETGRLHKRRKLLRPNFSKNPMHERKSINFVSADDLQSFSLQSVAGENNSKRKQNAETSLSEKNESAKVSCQISHADQDTMGERGSHCVVETHGSSLKNVKGDGDESSFDIGKETLSSINSSEETANVTKECLTFKNVIADSSSQDLYVSHGSGQGNVIADSSSQDLDVSHGSGQGLSPRMHEKEATEVVNYRENKSSKGKKKELYPNFDGLCPLDSETATKLTESSNRILNLTG